MKNHKESFNTNRLIEQTILIANYFIMIIYLFNIRFAFLNLKLGIIIQTLIY